MADNRVHRAVGAAVDWIIDKTIERWPTIVSTVGAGVMTYLASISEIFEPFGPVAWGGVGISSFLLLSFGFAAFSWGAERRAVTTYMRNAALTSGVNVLARTHEDERITLSTFYHPHYKATQDVRFENCELFGPANVVTENCSFAHGGFRNCEVVIIKENHPVMGAMKFVRCHFVRSDFYRVTFLMSQAMYDNMTSQLGGRLPVISGVAMSQSGPEIGAPQNPEDASGDA